MRNLKKVIALVAIFAMMVSTVAFAQTFTDVDEAHDYYEAIEMLSSLNILTGDDQDGDGKMDFRPNDTITRAEVAAVISRIQNITSAAQTATEFVDVPASHWASGYIAQAAGQGIVNGYGDGNFGPDDKVLYEQVVKMLVETLGYGPYVADQGGYPTGHLTAASRYGILEGVVGGAQGAEANRGMVAQMVYNAIDTPLMDRWTYGANAEYVIYNGKGDYDYVSLLSRDLGVKKFTGIVSENVVTSLLAANTIDTEEDAEIMVDFDYTDDYYNYDCDEIATIYEADSNAGELLGMHVSMYVKESGRKGEYEVISAAASTKNKVVEFALDQYAGYENGYIKYYKNESDRQTTNLRVEAYATATVDGDEYRSAGADLIYNNVAVAGSDEDFEDALNEVLQPKSKFSGKVKLVDNDSTAGYDVVFVEIGAPAVVEEVAASGKVTFYNDVKNSLGDRIDIIFDEEDNLQIIELTKGGVAIDYTELKEWDVLSILYNDDANYYVAKVLDSTAIEGSVSGRSVSETSAYTEDDKTFYKFTINGTTYDVSENYYTSGSKISVGSAGLFYIDEYGKIVAYDKNGTTNVSDAYGFILSATDIIDEWENKNIRVLMLDKSGEVYDASFAERVKIENAPIELGSAANDTYKLDDLADKMGDIAEAMVNQLITYEANSQGEIKTVTFPVEDEEAGESTLWLAAKAKDGSYDEEDQELKLGSKRLTLTEETAVFFINSGDEDEIDLGNDLGASKTASKVGAYTSIGQVNSGLLAYAYDPDNNDVPAAVVLFNRLGGISSSSNIAVIDGIGSAYVDDEVTSVTFFMGGEERTATVDPDLTVTYGIEEAKQGSLYKFGFNADGTVITAIKPYVNVTAHRAENTWYGKGSAPVVDIAALADGSEEEIFFGPVIDYRSATKGIKIINGEATDYNYDFEDEAVIALEQTIKASDANVYVYDPIRNSNKIYVGAASDVEYDDEIIENNGSLDILKRKTTTKLVPAGNTALGTMDYVVAVTNDEGDVIDVVIYKAYEFEKYEFATK